METATEISPLELDKLLIQLNKDLAEPARQIAELLQKFNRETGGHGADIYAFSDWQKNVHLHEAFGTYALARMELEAKRMDLPHAMVR